jgi:hypothetical protein
MTGYSHHANHTHHYPYPPGGPTATDRILEGAIDFHHHGYPEISFDQRTRMDDIDEMTIARGAGMTGVVLKSHMWPTVGRAYQLKQRLQGLEIIPSITLNFAVGGLNPLAIEAAGRQGAKMLFMPTWSAAHDIELGGMSAHLKHFINRAHIDLKPDRGIRLTSPEGKLNAETKECLDVAREFGMVVCSGHVSPAESIALADGAKEYGIEEVIFSHPDSGSVQAKREDIRDMVQLGAVCEFCALGCLPMFQRIHPKDFVDILGEIGADKTVLTTDYFFEWAPPASETLRMLIGTFLDLGVSEADVRKMVRDTPARVLGWTDKDLDRMAKEQASALEAASLEGHGHIS